MIRLKAGEQEYQVKPIEMLDSTNPLIKTLFTSTMAQRIQEKRGLALKETNTDFPLLSIY